MGFKILVVDDDHTTLKIMEDILANYEVKTVDNGEDMLKIAEKTPFDLILLDIMLPDYSGYDLFGQIRSMDLHTDTPVIFVSAMSEGHDIRTGLEYGAHDYITKPLNEDVIISRIEAVIKRTVYERNLLFQAMNDPLTGVYNRNFFFKRANEEISRACRLGSNNAIAMLDIDRFKNVNDRFGHQAGDFILKAFTEEIENHIRTYDLLARYGGEEFIILFVDCSKWTALEIVTRLGKVVEEKFYKFKSFNINFTFSGGISDMKDFDTRGVTIDDLIKVADRRLYLAKEAGRNRIVESE
ncbi:GGDEF domain-containing response regulator [Fusibacter sp. JL216-2]|uniref:GGDEF domain-containing response regulator n=1 Tax=Fusibacter sp. JL216-2 TaxID=3071453 RepID=UPI003D34788E